MELYKDYPRLCTIWCFIEILFYAGQLFGWSSLLYVLKQEGFYLELCSDNYENYVATAKADIINELYTNNSLVSTYRSTLGNEATDVNRPYVQSNYGNYTLQKNFNKVNSDSSEVSDKVWREFETDADGVSRCSEQDARLNLWFSIAICVSYVICSIMGPILLRIGMRNFRLLSMMTYIAGALCLGFATPEIPWLICPGLCCIGVAGMALYSTNIHVSFLFPNIQSTITAVFVGLYDASTFVTYLMKVAFDGGIPRKYYYIGLSIVHIALIGTSTLLLLPCVRIKPRITNIRTGKSEYVQTDKHEEKEKFIKIIEKEHGPSVLRTLISSEYLLHVFWMCVQGLRFVSFLGFFNTWLENKFDGNDAKENYYLGVFSYVTMATVITAITAGMLHDCQRRSYMMNDDFKRRRLPIILPLTVTSLMSIVITSLLYVEVEAFINLVFVLFTIYRSYLFSYEITFLNDVYPLKSFSVLFGILHSSAGLSGLLQYPVFEWYKSYVTAPNHVNIFLICLAVTSLAHPFSLWYRCRKHQSDKGSKYLGTEIYI